MSSSSAQPEASTADHQTSSTPPPQPDKCEADIRLEAEQYHPSTIAQDIHQGLGGLYSAAKGISLRSYNMSTNQYHMNVERSWQAGLISLGYDVDQLNKMVNAQTGAIGSEGDDVDNSVKIQGDTTNHIHIAPGAPLPPGIIPQPEQPKPQPKQEEPKPTQPPEPPPAPKQPEPEPGPQPGKPNGGMPTWAKWAIPALLATSIGGPLFATWMMKPQPPPKNDAYFAFDTTLPPWMQKQAEEDE